MYETHCRSKSRLQRCLMLCDRWVEAWCPSWSSGDGRVSTNPSLARHGATHTTWEAAGVADHLTASTPGVHRTVCVRRISATHPAESGPHALRRHQALQLLTKTHETLPQRPPQLA
jgi:hypothetical protein